LDRGGGDYNKYRTIHPSVDWDIYHSNMIYKYCNLVV